MSDIRKINCGGSVRLPCRTLTRLGGAKGYGDTRDAGLLKVELLAQVDSLTKRASPTQRAWVYYPNNKRHPVEIEVPNLLPDPSQSVADIRSKLDALYQLSPNSGTHEDMELIPADALAAYKWVLKQGKPVKARDIQRANIPQVKGYSANQIRELFLLLEQLKKGKTNGVEAEMTFTPFDC